VISTLSDIALQCDGVRCDMAMLAMNSIFDETWRGRAGTKPDQDYWVQVIAAVRRQHPEFRFIAEAYWDMEWELQQQGFDYCYDKRLYDRLEHDSAENVLLHLGAELTYQDKLVRFIENHDEPRAAATFSAARHRAAAVTALTLPGAKLIHEGQMEGRRVRLPLFLARRPEEAPDSSLQAFYGKLLEGLGTGDWLDGTWRLCESSGWPGNRSYLNLVSWCWHGQTSRRLIVVNLSDAPAQGQVRLPWEELKDRRWRLRDFFTSALYERDGDELVEVGLYVDLPAWGHHFLEWLDGNGCE
jgi:hypothetical protein